MSSTLLTLEHPTGAYQMADRERIRAHTTVADWLHLIRAEYLEIPGLHLTKPQVRRLWSLDELMSDAVLEALVDGRFLRRTHRGGYVRADS